jgi:hypothetical protein
VQGHEPVVVAHQLGDARIVSRTIYLPEARVRGGETGDGDHFTRR